MVIFQLWPFVIAHQCDEYLRTFESHAEIIYCNQLPGHAILFCIYLEAAIIHIDELGQLFRLVAVSTIEISDKISSLCIIV